MDCGWVKPEQGLHAWVCQRYRTVQFKHYYRFLHRIENDLQAVAGLPPSQAVRMLFKRSIRAKGVMDPYQRAWRLAWLGSREEALAEVEEAFRARSSMMPLVAVDPAFASIRKEARFQKVVRDMGL